MWKLLAVISLTSMAGMAFIGAILAVASLLADLPIIALNAVIIPIACVPPIGFLLWIKKEHRSPMVKAQNIVAGIWIVSSVTVLAHLIQLFSAGATTTAISSTGIELLWGYFYTT